MTILNNLEFPNSNFSSGNPELYEWTCDLESHARLVKSYFEVTAEQTMLMDQQRMVDTSSDQVSAQDEHNPILVELKKLDDRVVQIKADMIEIEGRAMTFEPSDGHEIQLMLRFIASVLAFGHKVDADYLADVMLGCADMIDLGQLSAKAALSAVYSQN